MTDLDAMIGEMEDKSSLQFGRGYCTVTLYVAEVTLLCRELRRVKLALRGAGK